MKHNLLIVALWFFGVTYSQNCNHTFIGEVIDFHDGTPMSGATIYIESLNSYTSADINGKFSIKNMCNGRLVLVISHVGCETKRITANVNGDSYKKILMEHHIEQLLEIKIAGNTVSKITKTGQESIINKKTIERFSNLTLGDALKNVSGVSSINTGNSIVKPIINGMHSSRILILSNNVRLQDQEWGIEHAPSIDINTANQISVIKGAGALAYGGDAIGGVVVIKPARAVLKDTLYGKTIFGSQTNGKGYHINTQLHKNYKSGWFAQLQASYKKNGDFNAPNYNLSNTGQKATGISALLGKKQLESGFELYYSFLDNEIGILRTSHIGSIFDLANSINNRQPIFIEDFTYNINPPKQDITHHLAKARYYKRFSNFGKLNFQYDYQNNKRLEFDRRRGLLRNRAAVNLELQTHSVLANIDLDTNLNRKLNIGVMGRYQNNFANPATGVRRLIPDYDKYDFGVYTTTEWRVNDNLIADGGIRYDFNKINAQKFYLVSRWVERNYSNGFNNIITASVFGNNVQFGVIDFDASQFLTNPVFNYHNISASTGINYTLNTHNSFIGNYALTSRPPNVSELFSDGLHHSAARFEIGDIRFKKEISNRISASHNYKSKKLKFVTELFYNTIKNYMYIKPSGFIRGNRGPFPIWEYTQTANAQFFGIDFMASYNLIKHWELQNKTAFIKAYDTKANIPLMDIPPFNTLNQITFNKESWYNFSASLKSEWFFEQNEFPDFNFIVEDALNNTVIPIDISTPPPAYHLLHFYSEATFPLSAHTNLNIALGINNVFNASYRNYLNRLRFFADEIGRNITLQVKLNY